MYSRIQLLLEAIYRRMNSSRVNYFEKTTREAQELVHAEQQPDFKPTDFDFEIPEQCIFCEKVIKGKPLTCSACKAPIYCSKEVRGCPSC